MHFQLVLASALVAMSYMSTVTASADHFAAKYPMLFPRGTVGLAPSGMSGGATGTGTASGPVATGAGLAPKIEKEFSQLASELKNIPAATGS